MPPLQCPDCGRFLSGSFVTDLLDDQGRCPRCDAVLTAVTDDDGNVAVRPAATAEASVRPPDLAPDQAGPPDPLAGWDEAGAEVVELERWRERRSGSGELTALVVAAILGAVVGAVVGRRRGRAGLLGAGLAVIAEAVRRRIWELEESPRAGSGAARTA